MPDEVVEKAAHARQVSGDRSRRQAPCVQTGGEVAHVVRLDVLDRKAAQLLHEPGQVPPVRGNRVVGRPSFHQEVRQEPLDIGVHADLGAHPTRQPCGTPRRTSVRDSTSPM